MPAYSGLGLELTELLRQCQDLYLLTTAADANREPQRQLARTPFICRFESGYLVLLRDFNTFSMDAPTFKAIVDAGIFIPPQSFPQKLPSFSVVAHAASVGHTFLRTLRTRQVSEVHAMLGLLRF